MEKIGFIGAYDKANFLIYLSRVLTVLGNKVLVVDTSDVQKIKYIVPSLNPTKSYITSFEDIDFAVGFDSLNDVEKYLGLVYDTNDDNIRGENKDLYDYILIDIDNSKMLEKFEIQKLEKNYFLTSFDMYSLKKGLNIFQNLVEPMTLTRILFSYQTSKVDEDYLNFISMTYKINWKDYNMYFRILGEDNKVFEDNQRIEKIRFRRLSPDFKNTLSYVVQDINKSESMMKIKKAMKD